MKRILFFLFLFPLLTNGQECIQGNCENGQGTMTYPGGVKYVGEWKNGKHEGQGVLTQPLCEGFEIPSVYNGYFKDNTFYGSGTLNTRYEIKVHSDNWQDLKTIKKITWPNGTKYELLVESDKSPKIDYNSIISDYVYFKVNQWQKKGEFEKIVDYKERVNEFTRNQEIEKHQNNAIYFLCSNFVETINRRNIVLNEYDAENETFLLSSDYIGEFILNVPIDEARIFKKYFDKASFNFRANFSNNIFTLSGCWITIDLGKGQWNRYEYSNQNLSTYAKTKIDYNFPEIIINPTQNVKRNRVAEQINSVLVGRSVIDLNIPVNPKVNNRYALIFGNEDYTSYQSGLSTEQNVDFAENDAEIFKEYALKTLGVKKDNLYLLKNATAGQMKQKIALVSKIIKAEGSNAELIFYYAGHGYPDEITKVPYLIPVDISASDLSSAINLADLYNTLAQTQAKRITVFLDACFTGGARSQGLVASRGIKISPKQEALDGNIVVFSASSETQSSLPYYDQMHGMFTYYLLEKLQESEGKCTYNELFNSVNKKVTLNSLKVNEKEQNPKVNTSQNVNETWSEWQF